MKSSHPCYPRVCPGAFLSVYFYQFAHPRSRWSILHYFLDPLTVLEKFSHTLIRGKRVLSLWRKGFLFDEGGCGRAMESMRKILIVDDDLVVREALNERLSSKGFKIFWAEDASKGFALAKQEHPDLILLDVMMPRQNGVEVFALLRQEPTTREIPVIFLTALSDGLEPFAMLNSASGYWMFGKPYEPENLLKTIRQVLDKTPVLSR